MIKQKVINGEIYYRISDIVAKSDPTISVRTFQRWISNGELVNFITVYQSPTGLNFYRLGVPHDDDVLVEGSKIKYKLPEGGD